MQAKYLGQFFLAILAGALIGGAFIWTRSAPEQADSSRSRTQKEALAEQEEVAKKEGVAKTGVSGRASERADGARPGSEDRSEVNARSEGGEGEDFERGPKVEPFTLPDLEGDRVSFHAFVDGRPWVVSFGQTQCPGCMMQLMAFKEVRKALGDKVAILEVNSGEDPRVVAAHAEKHESPFTTLIDMDGAIYARYGTGAIPVTMIGDQEGRIIHLGGYIPADILKEVFNRLLEDESAEASST